MKKDPRERKSFQCQCQRRQRKHVMRLVSVSVWILSQQQLLTCIVVRFSVHTRPQHKYYVLHNHCCWVLGSWHYYQSALALGHT